MGATFALLFFVGVHDPSGTVYIDAASNNFPALLSQNTAHYIIQVTCDNGLPPHSGQELADLISF